MNKVFVHRDSSAFLINDKVHHNIPSALSEISYHRLLIIILFLSLLYVTLAGRLINIVLFHGDEFLTYNHKVGTIGISRKEIIDRNGNLIATNLSIASLNIRPVEILDKPRAAKMIAEIFPDLSEQDLLAKLNSEKKFIRLKNNITPVEQAQINYIGEPGIVFDYSIRRLYPQGNLFSHIIGYIDTEGKGVSGIEKYFDEMISVNENSDDKLQLSVDSSVQSILRDELNAAIAMYHAKAAIGIVMDVNTGEVIAMSSLPDFNPNSPGESPADNIYNKATHGVYELGSVFKACTFAIAVDSGKVYLKDIYNVGNKLQVSRFKIGDYKKYADWLTVPEIFMFSSNIGTAKISLDIGKEIQKQYYKKFGLLQEVDIELPEVGTPLYPGEYNWSDVSMVTMSYGHGIALTPLHLATINAALVNGGYLYKPTLVKKNENDLIKAEKILSEETSDYMRRIYRLTVEKGTGRRADAEGYLVGGKTGSAEKVSGRGYHKTEKLSSFLGSFPIHDPKYTIFVLLDGPKSINHLSSTGGIAAAPIVKNIVQRIAPILGIKPVDINDEEVMKKLYLEYKPLPDVLESF